MPIPLPYATSIFHPLFLIVIQDTQARGDHPSENYGPQLVTPMKNTVLQHVCVPQGMHVHCSHPRNPFLNLRIQPYLNQGKLLVTLVGVWCSVEPLSQVGGGIQIIQ